MSALTRGFQEGGERFYVNRLLAHLEVEELESFERADGSPDFVLAWDGEGAGLDVTPLFHPSDWDGLSLQKIERARNRVLSAARQLWSRRRDPFMEVLVHFNGAQPFFPKDEFALAEQLVRIARDNFPAPNRWERIDSEGKNGDSLPEEIGSVSIVRLESYTGSRWSGGAGRNPQIVGPEKKRHFLPALPRRLGSVNRLGRRTCPPFTLSVFVRIFQYCMR